MILIILIFMMDQVKQEYVQQIEKKISNPQIKCISGNRVQKFCTNKDCRFQALCCRSQECQECTVNHQDCFFGQIAQLTKRVGSHLNFQKKIVRKFFNIENNLINNITANRKQIIESSTSKKNSNRLPKTICQIYFKNNSSSIFGADMSQIFSQLSLKNIQKEAEKCLEKYQKEAQSLVNSIISFRQSLLQSIFGLKNKEREQKSNLKKDQFGKKQVDHHKRQDQIEIKLKSINSLILKDQERLVYFLKELGNPSDLQLLFRASQNNFLASQFHFRCNNIKNTVTIIRNEFNKTLAGYTPVEWKSKGSHSADPFSQSFLLQLDLRQKMTLKKPGKAIYDHHKWGPSFGQGDILITDKCNQNSQSYTNFPYAYNIEGKYKNHQQICTAFSGVPNGKNFRVVQYEVFRVIP